MKKSVSLTKEGYKKLEKELEFLKTVKRKEVSEAIKTALSFGDLSENSEYDEAKNQQAIVESKIFQIENDLKNATIIEKKDIDVNKVSVGSTVKIKNISDASVENFLIVSSVEVDVLNGKISDESPVGKVLIGKSIGEIAEVALPNDKIVKYEILEITK